MTEDNKTPEEIYTHWKAMFDNKYMGPYSLASNCKSVFLTIRSVTPGNEKGTDGSKIEGVVVHFEETDSWVKPLWCGKHQCSLIAKALRPVLKGYADYAKKWIGFKVELSVFEEKWFGEVDSYLRIHKLAREIPKPVLAPNLPAWEKAVGAIANNSCSLIDVVSKRTMTEEHVEELKVAVETKKVEIELLKQEKGGDDA